MAQKEVLLAAAIEAAKGAFETAMGNANDAADNANQAASDAQVNYEQVQDAIAEALTQSDVDPNYISYDIGSEPDSTGATVGTIGAYFTDSGLLQKVRWDGAVWQEIGLALLTDLAVAALAFPRWDQNSSSHYQRSYRFLARNNANIHQLGSIGRVGTIPAEQSWIGGCLAPNGKIYCLPYSNNTKILVIDTNNDTIYTFGDVGKSVQELPGGSWRGMALAPNGKIYCSPHSGTTVLVIDPSNDSTYEFGSLPAAERKWRGCILADNGKIYSPPHWNATSVLVIDPSNDSTYEFGAVGDTADRKWRGGVLSFNGKIYCAPVQQKYPWLKIDPDAETVTELPLGGSAQNGAIAPNGKLFFASDGIFYILDPTNDTRTSVLLPSGNQYIGTVAAPNGKIYGIPFLSTSFLEIDPDDLSYTEHGSLDELTENVRYGTLAPNGKIYCTPHDGTAALTLLPPVPVDPNFALSRYNNKF